MNTKYTILPFASLTDYSFLPSFYHANPRTVLRLFSRFEKKTIHVYLLRHLFVRSCLHVDSVTLFQAALNQVLGLYGSGFVDHCEDESLLKDFAHDQVIRAPNFRSKYVLNTGNAISTCDSRQANFESIMNKIQ